MECRNRSEVEFRVLCCQCERAASPPPIVDSRFLARAGLTAIPGFPPDHSIGPVSVSVSSGGISVLGGETGRRGNPGASAAAGAPGSGAVALWLPGVKVHRPVAA